MNEIANYNKNNLRLFYNANDVAKEYGVYSKFVTVDNYADKPDVYLVFSVNPIPEGVNPVEIINRNERNNNLFYPENFAVNLSQVNPLLAWEYITDYLGNAEFMCELYSNFEVPLPKKIRDDELSALKTFYCGQTNANYDMDTRKKYAEGLREYFKQETSRGKLAREWNEFYRSELFDNDKSFVKNFISFLNRKKPEVKLDILLDSNDNLKKCYASEHHYKIFKEVIKEKYPDVKYSVSDKQVVDKGLIVDPNSNKPVATQYGLTVTEEEYDKICDARFAIEGFKCLDGLNPSYFEGRYVYYKASDENIIASVFNDICFRWAKCSSLEDLKARGKLEQIDIPASQMKNFYVGAKQHGIPFYIDNDVNRKPNLSVLHVLYNAVDHDKMGRYITGLTMANISLSHVSPEEVAYYVDIDKVDNLLANATERSEATYNNNFKAIDPVKE